MNPIVKIINGLIVTLNRIIDGMDRKTVDTIKQTYYMIILVIIAIGVYIGYSGGKGDAKKYGKPLASYTDEVFNTYAKKERHDIRFSRMVEGEIKKEWNKDKLKKDTFPANINNITEQAIESERSNKLIEPAGPERKTRDLPSGSSRERIAEVDRLDKPRIIKDANQLDKEMLSPVDRDGSYLVK